LSLVVLGVVASLLWTGCQPAIQSPVGKKTDSAVQKKAFPKVILLDKDAFRARLLMVEMIQTELGLTAEQIRSLKDFATSAKAQSQELSAKLREIPPRSRSPSPEEIEARNEMYQALFDDFKNNVKELQMKVLALLTPSQSERLKQIHLQATIPDTLSLPEIIKALDISEEQSAKIRALREDMDQKQSTEWSDLRALTQKDRREKVIQFMKQSNETQQEATKHILDVLTPEQRSTFEKLLGKKIDLTRLNDELMAFIPEDAEY